MKYPRLTRTLAAKYPELSRYVVEANTMKEDPSLGALLKEVGDLINIVHPPLDPFYEILEAGKLIQEPVGGINGKYLTDIIEFGKSHPSFVYTNTSGPYLSRSVFLVPESLVGKIKQELESFITKLKASDEMKRHYKGIRKKEKRQKYLAKRSLEEIKATEYQLVFEVEEGPDPIKDIPNLKLSVGDLAPRGEGENKIVKHVESYFPKDTYVIIGDRDDASFALHTETEGGEVESTYIQVYTTDIDQLAKDIEYMKNLDLWWD